jgi:phospholipid/cholesterol/gamma-HCH transport system substrate-binding protein
LDDNGATLTHDVDNLGDVTTTILQPEPRNGLETALHVLPTFAGNFNNLYQPAHSSLVGLFVFPNFANPIHFICSAIQAGSRLGYQDSAELCAQYLAPVLDTIKFNYAPASLNLFNSAATLPKEVAYSEERLHPPYGYKDTTVPGIFSRDTPFSYGNHEPGWVVAPGMQGTQVQPATANMLTAESLAELVGGQDIALPPPGVTSPGPPNSYDESNPAPPQWSPRPAQPGPGR